MAKNPRKTTGATKIDVKTIDPRRSTISHLPLINQNDTLQKFFNNTIDHFFQPKKVEKVSAYIGRKPSYWKPGQEFYKSEPSKLREDYQLEPTMVSVDIDNNYTNTLYYDDLLQYLKFNGSLVTNQNRLFETEYYSWSPPVDLDKLTSFSNYFWLVDGPNIITITEDTDVDNDVIGQLQYTFPTSGLTLSSGMQITLTNDVNLTHNGIRYGVEGVGRGIQLINLDENPIHLWDTNDTWDTFTWSTTGSNIEDGIDYIVMERGASDQNPWSTGNKWYHIDVINQSGSNVLVDLYTYQAKRPIIEFQKNLELYNFGRNTQLESDVVYTESSNIFNALDNKFIWDPSVSLSDSTNLAWRAGSVGLASEIIDGNVVAVEIDGVRVRDGLRILTVQDGNTSANNRIYEVNGIASTGRITLFPVGTAATNGTQVKIKFGIIYQDSRLRFDGLAWDFAQEKIELNQPIQFTLYDVDGIPLDDPGVYDKSTFAGNPIFSYQHSTNESQTIDSILGIPLSYNAFGEIKFENHIVTDRYQYDDPLVDIPGLQFWRIRPTDDTSDDIFSNNWNQITGTTRQFIIDEFITLEDQTSFVLSQEPEIREAGELPTVLIEKNGILLDESSYTLVDQTVTIPTAEENDFIVVKTFNDATRPEFGSVKYEVPLSLAANATQLEVTSIANSDWFSHFKEILENQDGFSGSAFGKNNWRDTAQDKTFGRTIIQHKAPLLRTMLLASTENLDFLLASKYVEREYTRFRNKLIQKFVQYRNNNSFNSKTPSEWVAQALLDINIGKTSTFPFFNSEMITGKHWIPPTPSRLGVNKTYQPVAYLDDTYVNDTWVIRGHDNSQYIMTGELLSGTSTSDPANLDNPIDASLLQYELDVYNSIPSSYKTDDELHFSYWDHFPGKYRSTDYTLEEVNQILQPEFERWVSFKGVNYRTNETYDNTNPFTWNYGSSLDIDGERVPGHWRGLYRWFYDTDRPHTHPWEMLGFSIKPSYWDSRYGSAPYTGGNALLWSDLESGIIASGSRAGTYTKFARPGLSKIIPVTNSGELRNPMDIGLLKQPPTRQQGMSQWVFGDGGPIENVWIKSEVYPFALAVVGYLMKPNLFIELGWDPNRYSYIFDDTNSFQWINTVTRNRPQYSELYVHGELDGDGNTYIGSGIQQWISDWATSRGQNITTVFGDVLRGLDVRLGHKLAGFTRKDNLRVLADNFGLVPQEDISVGSYLSPNINEYVYSGVIVQWNGTGWIVFGYDVLNPTFKTIPGNQAGQKITVSVGGSPEIAAPSWQTRTTYPDDTLVKYNGNYYRASIDHTSTEIFERNKWNFVGALSGNDGIRVTELLEGNTDSEIETIPYGTEFKDQQAVYDFLIAYGRWLESQGWTFDDVNNIVNQTSNWRTAGREFLFWSLTRWDTGNFIALSPSATKLKFKTDDGAIQNVEQTIRGVYAVVDKSGVRFNPKDTVVTRFNNEIEIAPVDQNRGIFGLRLSIKQLEHRVIFSNVTIFNDLIYDVLFNLRQLRLKMNGIRTMDWSGRLDAPGFIVQDDTIYSNFDKVADDFRNYYSIEESVDDKILRQHSRHILGYQPREYLTNLIPDNDVAFQFYQGLLQTKGTPTSLDKILRIQDTLGTESFTFYEEWLLRVGRYGAINLKPSTEIQLDRSEIRNNPQLVSFPTITDNEFNINVFDNPIDDAISIWTHQPIDNSTPVQDIRLLVKPSNNEHIWPLRSQLGDVKGDLPSAGYVKVDEVTHSTLYRSDIVELYNNLLVSDTPLELGQTIWVYDDGLNQFQVLRLSTLDGARITAIREGFPTLIELDRSVELNTGDIIAIRGETFTLPDFEGGFEVSTATSNLIELDISNDLEKDFAADDEVGPEIYIFENVRFPSNAELRLSDIEWQLGNIVWVDDARSDIQIANNATIFWATYEYNPSATGADEYGWVELRRDNIRVDNRLMKNVVIYNKKSNKIEGRLEVYDPRKGLIPSAADNDIWYKLRFDPAKYTNGNSEIHEIDEERSWNSEQLNRLWWNLETSKYIDYEIDDVKYRANQWGSLAPGIDVEVFQWIKSPVPPESYAQLVANTVGLPDDEKYTGSVKDSDDPAWVEQIEINPATGLEETVYYFWVRDVEITPDVNFRKLNARAIADIITNPNGNNIPWFAACSENSIVLGNAGQFLIDDDTVIQINWNTSETDNNIHSQWELMREGDPKSQPTSEMWNKMRDSLVGYDATNLAVPDPNLSVVQKYGTLIRPRQTWFKNLDLARQVFVEKINGILILEAITASRDGFDDRLNEEETVPDSSEYTTSVSDLTERDALIGSISTGTKVLVQATAVTGNRWTLWEFVNLVGQSWTRIDIQSYKVNQFWNYTTWYATGYSQSTLIDYQYSTVAARNSSGVTFKTGDIVKILDDGNGFYNIQRYNGSSFDTVGIEDGTIQFTSELYSYDQDTNVNGLPFPYQELRIIVEALNTDILTDLEINQVFFTMLRHVHSEQDFVDWAFKTSLLHITGLSEEVSQEPVLREDITEDLVAYFNEAKPYHTKIRDLIQTKNLPMDLASVDVTDFDKPVWLDPDSDSYKKLYLDLEDYLKDHSRTDPTGTNFDSDQLNVLMDDTPWKEWYDDFIANSSANVRKNTISIKLDRVSTFTRIPIDGSNYNRLQLIPSAALENSIYTLFGTTNSTIVIQKITLEIPDVEISIYTGNALVSSFATPKLVTDLKSLIVKLNSEIIFEHGVQVTDSDVTAVSLNSVGNTVVFNIPPDIGDTVEIIVDERFDDPTAYIEIGNTLLGVLDSDSVLQNPVNEPDTTNNGTLNFVGTKEINMAKSFDFDTDIKVTFVPGTSNHGRLSIRVDYDVDVRISEFDVSTLNAPDRVALFYNPRLGQIRKEINRVLDNSRIKGRTLYSNNTTDDVGYRPLFRVYPIPGGDYKGTILDGTPEFRGKWDTLSWDSVAWDSEVRIGDVDISGTEDTFEVYLFEGGVDGTDTFLLPSAGNSANDLRVSVEGVAKVLGVDYTVGSSFQTITFLGGSIPSLGDMIQVIVGDTFLSAPQGSSDINIEGNTFLQPHWEENRPEELILTRMDSSINMDVYFPGSKGSPIIASDRFIGNGTTVRYPLVQVPQNDEGVLVYVDGIFQTLDEDYSIDWNRKEIVFVNPPAGQAPVKVTVFGFGGEAILNQLTKIGGSDSYTLLSPSVKNNVFAYADGELLDYVVQGNILTILTSTTTSQILRIVTFWTDIVERKTFTGGSGTYALDTASLDADSILVSVDNAYPDWTLVGQNIILDDDSPDSDSVITITVFDTSQPSFIDTDLFQGTHGTAGSEPNSRIFTLTRPVSTSEPLESSVFVREDGLRLTPENVYYILTNGFSRIYFIDNDLTVTDPETNLTVWINSDTGTDEQEWGVDYVIPQTLRGTFINTQSIDSNLSDLGLTINDLVPGDYFEIDDVSGWDTGLWSEGGWDPNLNFNDDWNVTYPGYPEEIAFFGSGGIVWGGTFFSVIQNINDVSREFHFATSFTNNEVISYRINGDRDYEMVTNQTIKIFDVDPTKTYQITNVSVDTTYHINTQVFEETITGEYRISQTPYNGDFIWINKGPRREAERLIYMRDYRLQYRSEGYDLVPWDTAGWDETTRYTVVRMNPFVGTQAEFDAKVKDTIIITTMAGPPVSASLAYKMFRDFKAEPKFGNWYTTRISDHYKFRLRTALTSSSTEIELDVNPNILETEIPVDVIFQPKNGQPGVLHIGSERIEYWSVEGPFTDSITGRPWYRVGTLARGSKLTSKISHASNSLVITAGSQQDIGSPYSLVSPDTTAVPDSELAISVDVETSALVSDGIVKTYDLIITPSFSTITSVLYSDGSSVDQSEYSLSETEITFTNAPTEDLLLVQVVPNSVDLQQLNNRTTTFLRKMPGSYEV